jgi:hypothetical protein
MARRLQVLLAALLLAPLLTAQSKKPLSRDEVQKLLGGSVSQPRITTIVQELGVDFDANDADLITFRKAGAGDPLVRVIGLSGPSGRVAQQHVAQAQRAEREGLLAKAASEYTRAWELQPARSDAGIKAARLWQQRQDYARAGSILARLIATASEPFLAEARKMLTELEPFLRDSYEQRMKEGAAELAESRPDDAARTFGEAMALLPTRPEPHLQLARLHALGHRKQEMLDQLHDVVRLGSTINAEQILAYDEFLPYIDDTDFRQLLEDAYGPEGLKAAQRRRESVQRRQENAAKRAELERRIAQLRGEADQADRDAAVAGQKAQDAANTARSSGGNLLSSIVGAGYASSARSNAEKQKKLQETAAAKRREAALLETQVRELEVEDRPAAPPITSRRPAGTRSFQHSLFRIDYPLAWQAVGDFHSAAVTLAPASTVGGGFIELGVTVGIFRPRNPRVPLDSATYELVQSLQSNNPQLHATGAISEMSVAGGFARSLDLSNAGSSGLADSERAWLLSLSLPDSSVLYALFIAPAGQYDSLRRTTFEPMVQSLRLEP